MSKYVVHQNDANAYEIRYALERIGCTVMPGDWVDWIVGRLGRTYLLEVKTKRGKLSPKQQRLLVEWKGHYAVVVTVENAFAAVEFKPVPVPGKH